MGSKASTLDNTPTRPSCKCPPTFNSGDVDVCREPAANATLLHHRRASDSMLEIKPYRHGESKHASDGCASSLVGSPMRSLGTSEEMGAVPAVHRPRLAIVGERSDAAQAAIFKAQANLNLLAQPGSRARRKSSVSS